MKHLLLACVGLVAISFPSPALAGDRDGHSPTLGLLRGQAVEEGMDRAYREGHLLQQLLEAQERSRRIVPPLGGRGPLVDRNPFSPYLGLPLDIREGIILEQLRDFNDRDCDADCR